MLIACACGIVYKRFTQDLGLEMKKIFTCPYLSNKIETKICANTFCNKNQNIYMPIFIEQNWDENLCKYFLQQNHLEMVECPSRYKIYYVRHMYYLPPYIRTYLLRYIWYGCSTLVLWLHICQPWMLGNGFNFLILIVSIR